MQWALNGVFAVGLVLTVRRWYLVGKQYCRQIN